MTKFINIAEWKPLGPQTEPRLIKKNKILIHTMVGTLAGTDSMFRRDGYGGTESHFGTSADGDCIQWQDTDFQADANLEGNDDAISIENEDWGIDGWKGQGPVPPFTVKQLNKLVVLCTRICLEHDIPPRELTDSEDASKGIGTHRLGIDPYRKHGEHYSESYAKSCPGDARIKQVNTIIIPRVQQAVKDAKNPVPKTPFLTKALIANSNYRLALKEVVNPKPEVVELVERARRAAWRDFVALREFEVK